MAIVLPLQKERKTIKRKCCYSPALKETGKGAHEEFAIALPLGEERKRSNEDLAVVMPLGKERKMIKPKVCDSPAVGD